MVLAAGSEPTTRAQALEVPECKEGLCVVGGPMMFKATLQ